MVDLTDIDSKRRTGSAKASKGFKLLKKNGLRSGATSLRLGRHETGPLEPMTVHKRLDRRGLGAETPESSIPIENVANQTPESSKTSAAHRGGQCKRKRKDDRVESEAEKVERHRKETQKCVKRMFSDSASDSVCADISPLYRRNGKLSATNPLRRVS